MKNLAKFLYRFFALRLLARFNWTGIKYFFTGKEYNLTQTDIQNIVEVLLKDRVIGLNWKGSHFSSYPTLWAHWALTGEWSKWGHAWINVDDEKESGYRIKIYESVGKGGVVSPFWEVLNSDAVVLLRPKYVREDHWDEINLELEKSQGVPYDCYSNVNDQSEMNCVERVVKAILNVDSKALPGLTKMIEKHRVLTPQMFLSSGDFEEVLRIERY